jgi:Flp pilus assembly pilin Flp
VEVGKDGATVGELLRPEPKVGRVHASAASALPDEKGAGGAGYGLLAGAEVVQMIGKGTGLRDRWRIVHRESSF